MITCNNDSDALTAAIVELTGVRLFKSLGDADAITLQSSIWEDPSCWKDIALVWPRYTFHEDNTKHADALEFTAISLEEAIRELQSCSDWVAIDLVDKRVFTSEPLVNDKNQSPTDAMHNLFGLAPWWQTYGNASPNDLRVRRDPEVEVPKPHREVLWGRPLTDFFAAQLLAALPPIRKLDGAEQKARIQDETIRIHRAWLMSPLDELNGKIPRETLHAGKDWLQDLIDKQHMTRKYDKFPIPEEFSTFARSPFGHSEVIMYFDACRELLAYGWQLLRDNSNRAAQSSDPTYLSTELAEFLASWLQTPLPYDTWLTPALVIEFDHQRIPIVSRAPHACESVPPILEMTRSSASAPTTIHFDGHQLELDEDFAFSLTDTYEDWKFEYGFDDDDDEFEDEEEEEDDN